MSTHEAIAEILGFPVRIRGEASFFPGSLSGMRPKSNLGKRRLAVTIEFVGDSRKPIVSDVASTLRGTTFVLDLKQRELYLEPPASKQDFVRTVLFVIGLLAEYHGPHVIARIHKRRFAPLLMHSSAVCTRRGVLVFCGHSTYGKTTIATKLLRGCPLINEDLNILLVGPFGKRSRRTQALILTVRPEQTARYRQSKSLRKVNGLFWLKKADCFELEPQGNAESAANLLHPIFDLRRPKNAANRLKLVRALLDACPCQRLHFRRERPALLKLLRAHDYL